MKNNLYESIFILDTNTPNEDIDAFVEKLKKIITNYGPDEIKIDRLGKSRLAYEIDKRQYGYYISLEFTASGEVVQPLEEEYRLSDEVLRFMTYRITPGQLKQRLKDTKKRVAEAAEEGDK